MAEKGGSKGSGAIIGVALGTLAAAGGGFAFGSFVIKSPAPVTAQATASAKGAKTPAAEVKSIAPIVTNLRDPPNLYVRLEASVVLEPNTPEAAALTAKIGDDLVTYLRTVSLSEMQGPTGFQYFREDLRRRAIQLGGGKVRELLLQSFIIE